MKEEKKELNLCRSCGFENDPLNDYCVNCDKKFVAKRIPKKSERPKKAARKRNGIGATQPCPKCGEHLRIIDYTTQELDICPKC